MRVLVTGAAGFAGSHVVRLLQEHVEVIPFDGHNDWDQVVPTDVVISLAATGDPREALRDPAGAYTNDVRVMVNTLEYARRVGARVLHVSSSEVYGHGVTLPYRPRGPYAGGKACQEIVCGTYPDVPVTTVVTQSLFGERQQVDKLVPTIIRNLLAGDPVRLQQGRDGWSQRPFMHASNLADALLHLTQSQNGHGHRFHVGADRLMSVETVAQILADRLGRTLEVEAVPAGDRPGHESTVEPIGNTLPGWEPRVDVLEGLAITAHWYKANPQWLESRCAIRS